MATNPVTGMSPADAMKQLRKWKHAARAAALADPMVLRNPDFESYKKGTKVANPYFDWSYLALAPETAATAATAWKVVLTLTGASAAADRAVGSLMGLAIGDAFGAPFEFLPVDSRLEPPQRDPKTGAAIGCLENGYYKLTPSNWLSYLKQNPEHRPSHAFFDRLDSQGQVAFFGTMGEKGGGKFNLRRGQWTDDTSMALCLADSLLAGGKTSSPADAYQGGDARVRYFNWWACGINNAFKHDDSMIGGQRRTSVGLGGNIAASFQRLLEGVGLHKAGRDVPPDVSSKSEDAGNGSIMRLAPIPIRFAADLTTSMRVAAASSRATHPGADAEVCCAYMAFFISSAIASTKKPGRESGTLSQFVDDSIRGFFAAIPSIGGTLPESPGMYKLRDLLRSTPPDNERSCWNWRSLVYQSVPALEARGSEWNGHPTIPTYFGAYCMDGLSMALWAMHHDASLLGKYRAEQKQRALPAVAANDAATIAAEEQTASAAASEAVEEIKPSRPERFEDVISRVVNLRGDSDTTGAVAAQQAGAFFGFNHMCESEVGRSMVASVRTWDPFSEIPLRALMLADDGGLLDDVGHIGPDEVIDPAAVVEPQVMN